MDELTHRAYGNLPLSLGTSIAIESLMDDHIKAIKEYNEIWVNIRTLVRNLYMSLDAESQSIVSDISLANAAISEIENLDSVIKDSNLKLGVNYYHNGYSLLETRYKIAKFRSQKTPRQQFYKALLDNTYSNIETYFKQEGKIHSYSLNIEPTISSKAIMLTHSPIDLISEKYFKEVCLLESHTGKLKDRTQWYTKFSSQANVSIPMCLPMLSIFGDPEVFSPQPIKYRRAVIEVAEKYKWTCVTTLDRMKYTIGLISDLDIKNHMSKFIH